MDKKNIIIIVLAVLLSLCFLWGAWGNQYHKIYRADLHDAEEKITALQLAAEQSETIIAKEAKLTQEIRQQLLETKEELATLSLVRQDLELRLTEQKTDMENKIAGKDAALLEFRINSEEYIFGLREELAAMAMALVEKEQLLDAFHLKCEEAILEATERAMEVPVVTDEVQIKEREVMAGNAVTGQEINMLRAQIIGMKKIITERDNVIDYLNNSLDKIIINRDVLLGKIGDQNDALRGLYEDNRTMVKKLAEKNRQIADIQEQLQATPDQ